MALLRLVSKNPPAEEPTLIIEATAPYLFAMIAANQSSVRDAKISIWIEPFEYLPINAGEEEAKRAYIIKNATIAPEGSIETWRVAASVGDRLMVETIYGQVSYSLEAISQGA